MTADAVRVRAGRRVDVAFTPAELRRTQVAVVVDVLRASSTIAAALAAGYARVLCVGDVEQARRLRGPGRAIAGERGCRRIEGFDFGNSPRAFVGGATGELVLCTTNGTPAILAAVSAAEDVLVASLLNLDAVLQALPARADVTLVCSGTDGRFALEDAYAAGRIVDRLAGARSDAARAAERVSTAYGEPHAPLTESADARGAAGLRPGRRRRFLREGVRARSGAAGDRRERRRGSGLRPCFQYAVPCTPALRDR